MSKMENSSHKRMKTETSDYELCLNEINKATKSVSDLETLEKDPAYFIYEYFEEIKRQVDLRREDLKFKIDNYSDEIIQSIESSKANLTQLATTIGLLTKEIEISKNELNELIHQFGSYKLNDTNFKDMKESVTTINEVLTEILCFCRDSLLSNKKYVFNFNNSTVEDMFGSFDSLNETEMVNI
jgi:hypothetical protein